MFNLTRWMLLCSKTSVVTCETKWSGHTASHAVLWYCRPLFKSTFGPLCLHSCGEETVIIIRSRLYLKLNSVMAWFWNIWGEVCLSFGCIKQMWIQVSNTTRRFTVKPTSQDFGQIGTVAGTFGSEPQLSYHPVVPLGGPSVWITVVNCPTH